MFDTDNKATFDSVFANDAEKDEMFDVMFDEDDTLIEMVETNGFQESFGPDLDEVITKIIEEADPLEDADNTAERDGEVKHDTSNTEGECTEVVGAAVDGENKEDPIQDCDDQEKRDGATCDTKDVEGVDTKPVGAALESDDMDTEISDTSDTSAEVPVSDDNEETGIELEEEVDIEIEEDPLTDDDEAERDGEVPAGTVETEAAHPAGCTCPDCNINPKTESDPIQDADDTAERDGEVKKDTNNVEGVKTGTVGAAADSDTNKDPIADTCDCGEREGAIKHDTSNVEGKSTDVIGAAMESTKVQEAVLSKVLESIESGKINGVIENRVKKLLEGEGCDPIQDCDDQEKRDGATCSIDNKNVESVKSDVVGAAIDGNNKKDPIQDADDTAERDDEVKHDTSNIEGVDTKPVGAALESASDEDTLIDKVLNSELGKKLLDIELDDDIVPDSIDKTEASLSDVKESAEVDETPEEDQDDIDIEAIENNEEVKIDGDVDLTYSYDDDELIDLVIDDKEV